MRIHRPALPLLAMPLLYLSATAALACSPPPQVDHAGFFRHEVARLPKNALGVMFSAGSAMPSAADFTVVSAEDNRRLRWRVRRYRDTHAVRIEPEGGFQPGASYRFRYLRPHGDWRYPDTVAVTIDDAAISTKGNYALRLAPQAAERVITVPTGSGPCWEPVSAIAQEFTFAVPTQLDRYRTVLDYDQVTLAMEAPRRAPAPVLYGWPYAAELYQHDGDVLGQPRDPEYTAHDNAVVATCDGSPARGTLRGTVAFPEVDEQRYSLAPATFDLGTRARAECQPTVALVRTMQARGPERALRQVCGLHLGGDFEFDGRRLAARPLEEWERSLDFPHGLSPTCNLVGLAYLLQNRRYSLSRPASARLGAALAQGLEQAERMATVAPDPDHLPAFHQAVPALAYLVQHLPPATRDQVAMPLLAPLRPLFVKALAERAPFRPDELANLVIRSGALPPDLRATLRRIAASQGSGARHARTILAAFR